MDEITFELIPADPHETRFYFVVRDGDGKTLYDSQEIYNNNGQPGAIATYGRTYSKSQAYMRAWIVKNKLLKERQCKRKRGRPRSSSRR